jgi:hypothetical protein
MASSFLQNNSSEPYTSCHCTGEFRSSASFFSSSCMP